jgi:outer membrane protein OmpU
MLLDNNISVDYAHTKLDLASVGPGKEYLYRQDDSRNERFAAASHNENCQSGVLQMKKILLATSALAGVALSAQVAQAQITVTLGGYTEFFFGYYDDDAPTPAGQGRTDREFELETEIVVRADGKADNGLLYGTKVELQNGTTSFGTTSTGIVTDEASVYLGGTWGRMEFGDFDGAADTLKIYAPLIGIEQLDGDYVDFISAPGTTAGLTGTAVFGAQPAFGIFVPDSGDATKARYLTPRFAGFQAGVSYTPESGNEAQSVVAFENTAAYSDFFEFGANYTGEFAGFGVALSATGSIASGRDVTTTAIALEDFFAYGFGAQIKYAGFALGGNWVEADDFNKPTTGAIGGDQSEWHVGASYTAGPLAVGVSYMDAEGYKGTPGIAATQVYANEYQSYGIGVAYTLAPGFVLQSDVMFIDEEVITGAAGATTTANNDGYVWVVSTRLNF